MTEDQIHCANVARLLSATFPESDPDALTPPPPRGTEEPPSSFVEAQERRGDVRRSFERVGPDEAVELARQHARSDLEELFKAAGGEDEYRKALVEPRTVRGVAPPRVTLQGYVGAGGGRHLELGDACEVRGEDGSWRGGVVEAVTHIDGEFDWDTSAFTVDLLDGDQVQDVRGGDIRAPQKLVERTVRTGLGGFGERDFDARSPIGMAVALTTVSPETRADATLSAGAARRRSRAENLSNFGQGEDEDASMDDVGLGAATPSHVLDEATAPIERAPTSEADGDAMKIDAPPAAARARALPDATAPPLLGPGPATELAPPTTIRSGEGGPDAAMADAPAATHALPVAAPSPAPVAAPETTTAASEPAPPTTPESVGGDGDAVMAPAKNWRDIARKFHEVAGAARKIADKKCFALVPLDREDAKDYVPRVVDKYSKRDSLYNSLARALLGREGLRGLKLAAWKDAISGALEGVSAADFRDESKFTEAAAPTPAPAPPRSMPEQAWEPDARKMLNEVRDRPAGKLGPILTRYGFTCTGTSRLSATSNNASPPEGWPCVYDIVGNGFGTLQYQDVICSKTQLVSYLEEALKQASAGTSFRSQSQKKADDARAAAQAPSYEDVRAECMAAACGQRIENAEADVNWWHDLAEDPLRHNLYRGMRDKGIVIIRDHSDEPFQLLSPSNKKPPTQTRGFYAGSVPLGVHRREMSEDKCTTAEQKAAWRKAKWVCEILNGVRDRSGREVVPGVYYEEYEAWKTIGGDDSVVGSREERQDYSKRGLYAKAIRDVMDAMRHDDPWRFYRLTLGAVRSMIGRSERHLTALAKHAGVDKEDLVREDSYGQQYFVSGYAPCRLPGVLHGLLRPLHIEHVNGSWVGNSATLELKVRGFEDSKFNRAEPHYAFVTRRPGVRAFVDGYLNNEALCFSKDGAERKLFQMLMGPMSTGGRREFLALPSDKRSKEERYFLKRDVMAGVVKPKTDEDRRRRDILYARHEGLNFVPNAHDRAGFGTWKAVSRVKEREKEIGRWYGATVLRQYGSGNTATFDVRFNWGYVAKGVTAGNVRRGSGRDEGLPPDVGATGETCYRGTKLDLDHVGLGWRWERVVPSTEYPDGLKWYRILGIRDLLDYDINQNLSGYEWAKNLDLFDYFENYYKNALCEVGGYGLTAKEWVFKWTPALGWAYGGRY